MNLVWATLMLVALPMMVTLAEVAYQIPDLTYTLLASGVVALVWAGARTAWAVLLLRRMPAPIGAVPSSIDSRW